MSALCITCGLCCDGTMYTNVDVQETDGPAELAATGMTLVRRGETLFFDQPCSSLRNGCCAIYEIRPTRCRNFRCALLRKCDVNAVSTEDAMALIAEVKAVRDRVRPGAELLTHTKESISMALLLDKAEAALASMDSATRGAHGELFLEIAVLRVLLRRHFEVNEPKVE